MTRQKRRLTAVVMLSLALSSCGGGEAAGGDGGDSSGLANPASVYCAEQGGSLDIRLDENGGAYGVCVFETGVECEEWAYFRGECSPKGAALTIDEALAAIDQSRVTVTGYLFVDREGNARLASAIAESYPPQAGGSVLPAQIDLSPYVFSEEQGLRWTDQPIEVEGTIVDGVLVGLLGRSS